MSPSYIHQAFGAPTKPLRMISKIAAILSLSGVKILQFYTMLPMILLGLYSDSNFISLSVMNSVISDIDID